MNRVIFFDRFCFCCVLVLGLVHVAEFFLAAEADNLKVLPSMTRVQCVTRLFLPWVEFHSFHFQQVRIQTVPASHLQQGTVSGSTKAVSTVVVTTAPSPKQTQDQLWTLVWKWVALQELPWARGHPPPKHPRLSRHSPGGIGLDSVTLLVWSQQCHV